MLIGFYTTLLFFTTRGLLHLRPQNKISLSPWHKVSARSLTSPSPGQSLTVPQSLNQSSARFYTSLDHSLVLDQTRHGYIREDFLPGAGRIRQVYKYWHKDVIDCCSTVPQQSMPTVRDGHKHSLPASFTSELLLDRRAHVCILHTQTSESINYYTYEK